MKVTRMAGVFLALFLSAPGCQESDGPSAEDTSIGDANEEREDTGILVPDMASTSDTALEDNVVEACPAPDGSQPSNDLYYHRVQKGVSADPTNFQIDPTVVLNHASVPDAILREDGATWVYVINGIPGQHAFFIAEENDTGMLEVFDCIRTEGKINGNAVDPDIVQLSDGRYRLFYYVGWFTGNGGPPPGAAHPMYTAVSEDGIHFTEEELILEIDGGGTDPTAIQLEDDSWLLAFAHPDGVQLASSADGSGFEMTGQVFGVGIPELHRFDDGTLRLYVMGISGLVLWRSDDNGATWQEETSKPFGGADPSLIQTGDGEWTLFVKTIVPKDQRE